MLSVAFGKKLCWCESTTDIILHVAPAIELVLSVAFEKNIGDSSPINGLFLYVAPAVGHVLAVAFEKKTILFLAPLSAYFNMLPRQLNTCYQ